MPFFFMLLVSETMFYPGVRELVKIIRHTRHHLNLHEGHTR